MKFSNKLSFTILITGLTFLVLLSFMIHQFNYQSFMKSQLMYTQSIVDKVSGDIDLLLNEKVKTALTLANTPIIIKNLETSNSSYADLSDKKREGSIKGQNKKWKSIKNPADNFILKFTNNDVSRFLKNQQATLKDEYGEIFLTNKFGALVGSTSKLSTFAHGHKYWWLGSYNNGSGAVFFDDRGYDDSVGGYVLGLVVPVRKGMEIIGILKCNLNIFGSVSKLILSAQDKLLGDFKLTRSGGMIVFEEGFEPLSRRVHDFVFNTLKNKNSEPFILYDFGEKYLVGFSEIKLTKGEKGYGFGGTFESIDHKKGNTGESWYVLGYRQMSLVMMPIKKSIKSILLTGATIIFVLALVSYLFGRSMAKPLAILDKATEKIGRGKFEFKIDIGQNDEFGNLANSFNSMVSKVQQRDKSLQNQADELMEKNLELDIRNKQIEKTNSLKDEFLSTMSHELRTPLNSVITLSHILINYTDKNKKWTKDEDEYLEVIHRNGEKLLALVNDILDLSKIESGRMDVNISTFSVRTMIVEILDGLEIISSDKNIYLTNKISEDLQIESDPIRLYQVLQNLISNAVKFTDQGGVTITGGCDAMKMHVEIIDSGIGISKEELSYIFDKFRQVDSTNTRKYEGTGLGLAIAHKAVKILHGDLTVESIPGKGSTFTLSLPVLLGEGQSSPQ